MCTDRRRRVGAGSEEMVEAITGRELRGISGSSQNIEIVTLFKFGERNRSR